MLRTRFLTTLAKEQRNPSPTHFQNAKPFDMVPTVKENALLGGSIQEFFKRPGGFSKLFNISKELHEELGPIFRWKAFHIKSLCPILPCSAKYTLKMGTFLYERLCLLG